MLSRTSLGLLLLVAVAAAWMLLQNEPQRQVVRAARPLLATTEGVDDPRVCADSPARAGAPREAIAAAPEPAVRMALEPDVLVRVRLVLDPQVDSDADWRVELQTWDEDLDTVRVHHQRVDGIGRAEFRLQGAVHVDWVRVVPPDPSGLAFAFVEEHVDLRPGSIHEVALAPGPGGRIAGRVLDLAGRPAAGARVHAFADGSGEILTQWQPGLIAVESDAQGRFSLPRLPPGDWGLAVEPGEWLGYAPATGESIPGSNLFAVRADQQREDALLTVVRAAPLVLRLIDPAGAPIPGASVHLEPLLLLGGRMLLEVPPEPDAIDVLMGRAMASTDGDAWLWPYGALARGTNARGEVRLFGVPGAWTLSIRSPFGSSERDPPELRRRVELPVEMTWTLDERFEVYRGRLVDEGGGPLENAWVTLRPRGTQDVVAARRTDDDGCFAFEWLRPSSSYEAVARRSGYLTRAWDVAPTPPGAPPADRVLRKGVDLRLTLVDPAGDPIPNAVLILQDVRPSELETGEHAAIEEIERRAWLPTGSEGTVQLRGMPDCEIDLALQRNVAIHDGDGRPMFEPSGQARFTQRLVRHWTLCVPPAEQRLVIDISAWPEPRPQPMATHTGRIVDSAGGVPIGGALVLLQTQQQFHLARSDEQGHFALRGLPGPCELLVHAEGFAAQRIPARAWEPVEHEHEFALLAGVGSCEIVIEDRDGARLPKVQVTARDAEERPLQLVRREPDGAVRWGSEFDVPDGRLCLLAPPPGELYFDVGIEGAGSLGRCRVTISDAATPRTVVTRLDRSLDQLRAEVLAREAEDTE